MPKKDIFYTSFDQLVIDMVMGEPIPRQDQKPAKLIAKVKKTHTAHTALLIISSIRLNDVNYKVCAKLTKLIINCKVPKLALIVHTAHIDFGKQQLCFVLLFVMLLCLVF